MIFLSFFDLLLNSYGGNKDGKVSSNATEYSQNYFCVSVKIQEMKQMSWSTKGTHSKVDFEFLDLTKQYLCSVKAIPLLSQLSQFECIFRDINVCY